MCVEQQHTELPLRVLSSAANKKNDTIAKKKIIIIPEYFLAIISCGSSKGEVVDLFVGLVVVFFLSLYFLSL